MYIARKNSQKAIQYGGPLRWSTPYMTARYLLRVIIIIRSAKDFDTTGLGILCFVVIIYGYIWHPAHDAYTHGLHWLMLRGRHPCFWWSVGMAESLPNRPHHLYLPPTMHSSKWLDPKVTSALKCSDPRSYKMSLYTWLKWRNTYGYQHYWEWLCLLSFVFIVSFTNCVVHTITIVHVCLPRDPTGTFYYTE